MNSGLKIILVSIGIGLHASPFASLFGNDVEEESKEWTFVSVPDFLNRDTLYPQEGFEDALTYFLQAVKAENPDFVLVAGDIVNGRWPTLMEPTAEAIVEKAEIFYPAWKARMEANGLKYYVAIGDHEIGDDPWPDEKAELVPIFEREFVKHLQMPLNGPEHMKGTAFSVFHKGTLFVSLNVFEPGEGHMGEMVADVSGEQLKWLDELLASHEDANHIVVMGHAPILGPVAQLNSGGIMLEKGRDSQLWKTLSSRGVDLYLCGEVHAITCTERDSVQQIAHGSLFGWNPTVNYLVGKVTERSIELELKEIDVTPNVVDGISLSVSMTPETLEAGFRSVGTMKILKTDDGVEKIKTGSFQEEKESL